MNVINPLAVVEVLLLDGWHTLKPGSFVLGDLRIGDVDGPMSEFLNIRFGGECCFSFTELDGRRLSGPLSSIVAVRH
jgi:hypothetical protein